LENPDAGIAVSRVCPAQLQLWSARMYIILVRYIRDNVLGYVILLPLVNKANQTTGLKKKSSAV